LLVYGASDASPGILVLAIERGVLNAFSQRLSLSDSSHRASQLSSNDGV
jgi:hypothetical protein